MKLEESANAQKKGTNRLFRLFELLQPRKCPHAPETKHANIAENIKPPPSSHARHLAERKHFAPSGPSSTHFHLVAILSKMQNPIFHVRFQQSLNRQN